MALAQTTETVKAALLDLAAAHGGALSPQLVVETARDPTSPLHSLFEWDDQVAAEKFRIVQARIVLRIAIPTYDHSNSEPVPIRLFTSVAALRGHNADEHPSYLPSITLMSNEDRRQMLVSQKLSQAKNQLGGMYDPALERAYRFLSRLIERVDKKRGVIE